MTTLHSTETTAVEEMTTSPAKDADSIETTAAVGNDNIEEMTTSPAKDADSIETTAAVEEMTTSRRKMLTRRNYSGGRRNDNIASERC